jgi:heme iron utilization protein
MAKTPTQDRLTPGVPDPRQPADFDPLRVARDLLRRIRVGTLGTLTADGAPMTTLSTVATDSDGMPLIFTSRLSAHTTNLLADPRFSLLLAERGKGDPLAHPRLTLNGRAEAVSADDPALARYRLRFLNRHPKAQIYIDFPDFLFWRLVPSQIHLNGGFARAYAANADGLLLAPDNCVAMAELETGAIEHMNADHADAVALYAMKLAGMADGAWRISGLDAEGMDLQLGDETARVLFPAPVTDAGTLRGTLAHMAKAARA